MVLGLTATSLTLQAQLRTGDIVWTPLPRTGAPADTAYRKGVSAAFAGLIGDHLVLAGGCNFPDRPAADGGAKRYYDDVYVLAPGTDGQAWIRAGHMPDAAAYGVALPTDKGLAFIGGTGPDGPSAGARELRLSADGRTAQWKDLPPLPVTVDNMAGARLGRRLYVAGGNADGTPSQRVFSLSLDSLTAGWREETPMPGEPRVQPVAAALRHGGEMCLYVFGGFAAAAADRAPSVSLTALRYVPSARRWEQIAAPADERGEAIALGGGAGYALGDTAALCLGGVDKDIFLAALRREQRLAQARATGDDSLAATLQAAGRDYMTHKPAWYRFNRRVLRYSAAADRWTTVNRADQAARAGAALTGKGTTFYYLGGELKPGIRTPDLWQGQYR